MTKELTTKLSAEQMEMLENSYPVESTFNRILLPRLGFYSQDQVEGKGKAMKVTSEAGTFYIEVQVTEEVKGEDGKMYKPWVKTELGSEISAVILYERRQLKFFDGEKYTSSPIFDSEDSIIPLFRDKKEVDRGTPEELKAREEYQGVTAKGKPTSKLEENKILYVLLDGIVYQMSLRGTSLYAFKDYKKTIKPNTVLTKMNSEPKENGSINWNVITYEAVRGITSKEFDEVIGHIRMIETAVRMEQAFYKAKSGNVETLPAGEDEKAFKALGKGKKDTDM